jgi:hypothetical protein
MRRHIPQRFGGTDQEESATSAGCTGGIHRGPKKGSSSQFVPGVSWGGARSGCPGFGCIRAARWENRQSASGKFEILLADG